MKPSSKNTNGKMRCPNHAKGERSSGKNKFQKGELVLTANYLSFWSSNPGTYRVKRETREFHIDCANNPWEAKKFSGIKEPQKIVMLGLSEPEIRHYQNKLPTVEIESHDSGNHQVQSSSSISSDYQESVNNRGGTDPGVHIGMSASTRDNGQGGNIGVSASTGGSDQGGNMGLSASKGTSTSTGSSAGAIGGQSLQTNTVVNKTVDKDSSGSTIIVSESDYEST